MLGGWLDGEFILILDSPLEFGRSGRRKAMVSRGICICMVWVERALYDGKFKRFTDFDKVLLNEAQLCEYDTLWMLIISIHFVQILFS